MNTIMSWPKSNSSLAIILLFQMKLESMAVGDDISIHSSASQENHQHRDHHK